MYPDYRSCVETTAVQYLYDVICNIILLTDTIYIFILYLPLTDHCPSTTAVDTGDGPRS